ncbi:MAG: hypothetical protein ACMXYK_03670 [Candidatus Woesearchaeota archaeon]
MKSKILEKIVSDWEKTDKTFKVLAGNMCYGLGMSALAKATNYYPLMLLPLALDLYAGHVNKHTPLYLLGASALYNSEITVALESNIPEIITKVQLIIETYLQ